MKAPARKRARIIESDEEEEENNVEVENTGTEKKTAQRLEKVCEEKQLVSTIARDKAAYCILMQLFGYKNAIKFISVHTKNAINILDTQFQTFSWCMRL